MAFTENFTAAVISATDWVTQTNVTLNDANDEVELASGYLLSRTGLYDASEWDAFKLNITFKFTSTYANWFMHFPNNTAANQEFSNVRLFGNTGSLNGSLTDSTLRMGWAPSGYQAYQDDTTLHSFSATSGTEYELQADRNSSGVWALSLGAVGSPTPVGIGFTEGTTVPYQSGRGVIGIDGSIIISSVVISSSGPVNNPPSEDTTQGTITITHNQAMTPVDISTHWSDAEDTLTFTANQLPAGLSMTTAGVISGTPTTVGTTSVTVTADDGTNTPVAGTPFNITVEAVTLGPQISSITDMRAESTATATMDDTTGLTGITFNGVALADLTIASGTTATFTVPKGGQLFDMDYPVVATNASGIGNTVNKTFLPATGYNDVVLTSLDVDSPLNNIPGLTAGDVVVFPTTVAGGSFYVGVDGTFNGAAIPAGTHTIPIYVLDASDSYVASNTGNYNYTPPVNTAPVITLLGTNPMTIVQGASYNEPGATATDSQDGDLTGSIVIGGDTVNNTIAGTYIVTYNVTDSGGLSANELTRTVTVTATADTTRPIIVLNGDSVVNHPVNTTYTDAGASASDNIDGDLTGSIVVGGDTVDDTTIGTYVITYNVSDSSGNAAFQVSRTVNVVGASDTTPPVITLNGQATLNHIQNTTYTDAGASASDDTDGDISGNIVVTGTVNTAVLGSYILRYNVSDSAGNAANEVTRTVTVISAGGDVTVPVITLNGSATVNHTVNTTYTDAGATALDNVDGDITANIVVTGTVNTTTIGSYTLRYNVSDAAGNAAAEVTRTVNVVAAVDTTPPVITLNGSASVNVTVGGTYNELGATATDNVDGNITNNIVISGSVDTGTIGSYIVRYNVSDAAGNAAQEVTRTVNVVAVGGATITLTPKNTTQQGNPNFTQGTSVTGVVYTTSPILLLPYSATVGADGSISITDAQIVSSTTYNVVLNINNLSSKITVVAS